MRAFVERHFHSSLLVVVLLAQLLFLAYQIKGDNDVRLIRRWTVAVLGPVEWAVRESVDMVGSVVDNYVALYNARQQSHRLQAELDAAQLRLRELEARARETDRLAALLDLKQAHSLAPLVAAQVIGSSPASSTRTVLIDRGRDANLTANMAVITPEGVVGKIVAVFPTTSQVLLITDRKSGVGVRLTGSEVGGVVKGTGAAVLELDYVPNDKPVTPGTELLTSGQDQLFPKGLPVGRIEGARPGEFFQEIRVTPAADLGRLEQVLVLAGPPQTLGAAAENRKASASSDR